MEGFKPVFDNCEETFGAHNQDEETEMTIHLMNGSTIEANAVGVDFDDNVFRHFTWEEFTEERIRDAIEDEPVTFEEVMDEGDVELGEPFMMMNGMGAWENVADIEMDTKGLFD
jgi:hypothetical protein